MTSNETPIVSLVDVDEWVLEQLVHAAVSDACADDVTPPITAGAQWTPARIEWLETFHRDRRAGLNGPSAELTWAVAVGAAVVGSVRLQRTDDHGVLETGVWLARGSRGRGVATAAMRAVLSQAAAVGARGVRAETTTGNTSALGLLCRLGFDIEDSDGHCVRALLMFRGEPQPGLDVLHTDP